MIKSREKAKEALCSPSLEFVLKKCRSSEEDGVANGKLKEKKTPPLGSFTPLDDGASYEKAKQIGQ
jgi:hypothetical protein